MNWNSVFSCNTSPFENNPFKHEVGRHKLEKKKRKLAYQRLQFVLFSCRSWKRRSRRLDKDAKRVSFCHKYSGINTNFFIGRIIILLLFGLSRMNRKSFIQLMVWSQAVTINNNNNNKIKKKLQILTLK